MQLLGCGWVCDAGFGWWVSTSWLLVVGFDGSAVGWVSVGAAFVLLVFGVVYCCIVCVVWFPIWWFVYLTLFVGCSCVSLFEFVVRVC